MLKCCWSKNINNNNKSEVVVVHQKKQCNYYYLGISEMSIDELSTSIPGSNLHAFTHQQLRLATHNFALLNLLGQGGFGAVYKAFIHHPEPLNVAVKVLDLEGTQGHKEWLAEVIYLGQLKHPQLVKLIGYCCENDQRLLVYEYMARGNLDKHLFSRRSVPLPWLTRIKIALEAAKGLSFLHELSKPVIFRDFKTANILLDADYSAKLSDFGFARDGPDEDKTHVSTKNIIGTNGYAAPEYIMTGRLTTQSDVYSFGVVLLEILTGRRSMDKSRPKREQYLVEWARSFLKDPRKLDSLMDPRLEGQYSIKGSKIAAMLAYQCLSKHPKSRPRMSDVIKVLEPLLDLKDMFGGPFVYVVASNEGSKDQLSPQVVDKVTQVVVGNQQGQQDDEEQKG